jgi:hypothetical protein
MAKKDEVKLGLDISSSVIGVAITKNKDLLFYEHIDISKINISNCDSYFDTLDTIEKYFKKLKKNFDITVINIEEPIKKMSDGKSSINTIVKLYSYNFPISWMMYKLFDIRPNYIKATSARKQNNIKMSEFYNIYKLKYVKKVKLVKVAAMTKVIDYFPWLAEKFTYTRNGNIDTYWFDIADAIIISLSD